jgi:hypothetical protein
MSTPPDEPAVDGLPQEPEPGEQDSGPGSTPGRDQEPEGDEEAPSYVDDSQLPEDLRPDAGNPLAQNPDE